MEDYSFASATPTTRAVGDLMVSAGLQGDLSDFITVLYVTERTYLDRGARYLTAGKRPDSPAHREWIYLRGRISLATW